MEFVSDEQRKAVFAKLKGGSSGGGGHYRKTVHVDSYQRSQARSVQNEPKKKEEKQKRAAIKNAAIWAVKNVAQAAIPPAAPAIEVAYQVYKHGPAISQISSYVEKGNLEEAKKLVAKETASELAAVGMAEMASYSCEKIFENMHVNEKVKEYYAEFLEGALDAINK